MNLNKAIAEVFKEKIEHLGMKKKDLAKAAGVSNAYITKLLKSEMQSVGFDKIVNLTKALGMTTDQFLGEVEKKKSSEGVSLSRAEVEELLRIMTYEEKKGFVRRLRERLPELPEWLKTETHIKYVQNLPDEPLIQGIAADGRNEYGHHKQPQEG